jgi:glycosyltransferase involved in cell wall biosynthesis
MRLLEVETFGRGGLIHYAYNLSCALARRGHELTLVTAAGYELEDRAGLPANVRLIKAIGRFTAARGASWPELARVGARRAEALYDAFAVSALARRLRPELIHLHCTNPIALAYLAGLRLLGVPLVATAHIVTPHEPIRFQRAIYRPLHRLADLVVAHSEVDRSRLVEEFAVDSERVVVIPHGEYGFFERGGEPPDRDTARRALGLVPADEVALFFGYIREYKGLDVLLEAWQAVLAARPRARLLVAGDPVRLSSARRAELERWAERLGAVHRFGYVPFQEVPRYFAAADLLVMPYRRISQSGVLYLALALGVPVVATRVGALPEMLRDGDTALLVPPESPAELAAALIRALADPELRGRLARGGRRLADRHSWPAIAEQTETAFARLVASYADRS